MAKDDVIVVGLGEVGRPLLELVREKHTAIGIDIEPVATDGECAVLHICYPFSDQFVRTTVKYIEQNCPALTIINSTVAPGTTRSVYRYLHTPIVYSPIRGKHFKMKHDFLHYTKFIGGIDHKAALRAAEHFRSIGMKTKVVSSPETAELAKLTETTYFGLLIAWAQEAERYCNHLQVDYDQLVSFFDEIPFLPRVKYVPGVIGGHCVMPNIQILKRIFESDLLDAIVTSNNMKREADLVRDTAPARHAS
jgi:UDP-N-acetyl-D-mannosaminuronate dehydrogenase